MPRSNMKSLTNAALKLCLLLPLIWGDVTLAAPGDLDDSFGAGGIVELVDTFSVNNGSRVGLGVQSTGGIIAGTTYSNTSDGSLQGSPSRVVIGLRL